MGITKDNGWRVYYIFISFLSMLVALFVSRMALSVSMGLFLTLTLLHKDFFKQLKSFSTDILLVSLSLLFLIPFISGLWSNDPQEWLKIIRIKLPLLFFPIAFAGGWQLSKRQWDVVAIFFLLLVFGGCCWSLFQYLQDVHGFHKAYLKAKLITTPLENDHIRFSWLVTVAIITSILLLDTNIAKKAASVTLMFLTIFFAIYLHILASRMGLFCFYLFVVIYATWLALKKNLKKSIVFLAGLILLPLIAWLSLPSFQNRTRYFVYDINQVRSGIYEHGSNDGARVLSLRAGWTVLKQNPFGVGAGDLKQKVNEWYDANNAGMPETQKFLPCSEWLVFGGFSGWPGILLLMFVLFLPFVRPVKNNVVFWYCLNGIVVFSFVFDMSIEAQFGVFIYAAIILWWWKWLNQPRAHE